MTPIVRWLKKSWEKLFGTWSEGPQLPDRFHEMVIDYANREPQATRADWIRFATLHAGVAYRSGYQRGYEWAEREGTAGYDVKPEDIADGLDPDWKWSPDILLEPEPDEVIGERVVEDHVLLEDHLRRLIKEQDEQRRK